MEQTRHRLTCTKAAALRYVGHLDWVKVWERILRRAGLPIVHSQGFHPQPKMHFASALPVGCASVAEVLDVFFTQPLAPHEVQAALVPQLPAGMRLLAIEAVPLAAPALQATLCAADYELTVQTTDSPQVIAERIHALLAAKTLPRERRSKAYDLRPLIVDVKLVCAAGNTLTLAARLRASQTGGAGRPDELLDALGLSAAPAEICRVGLAFE
jgi:radical SAM-linked protein